MSKRPASPPNAKRQAESGPSRKRTGAIDEAPTNVEQEDQGMGEFEDTFEDEYDDDGEVIDAAEQEEEDDDDIMDVDGQEIVRHDGAQIEEHEASDNDEEEDQDKAQAWMPGVEPLAQGHVLEPDQSAYEMLHRLNVTWPCLSFDILQDHFGPASERVSFPHTAYFVAGTQADVAKNNELQVFKASSMHRTQKDGDLSDDEEDDDDGLDDDAILETRSIPHLGGINRVRAAPVAPASSSTEACLDAYPVATWSELGSVSIWDIRPLLNALDRPGAIDKARAGRPLHTIEHGVEGYALDWAGSAAGTGKASSLRLLSGDGRGAIKLTTSNNSGFSTHASPFLSHTSSVEDVQWSPKEPTVFASCSADRSIRVWDVRVKSRKAVITLEAAHEQDVNVISWNRQTDYLLLSGGDEGHLNVWDLRSFKPTPASGPSPARPSAVATFQWHTAPISSVEWHPSEDSVFAAAGRDDQVTLWDLSVEQDDDETGGRLEQPKGPDGHDVPSQLLFCHHGASEIKELHWHPQINGMLMSTSADGFHLFKTISV